MRNAARLLFVWLVVTLVCALAAGTVEAQTISITPANPTLAAGETQAFTATGIDTATAVEAGAFHQCALLQDTTVRCWGLNDYGQLGNGTMSNPPTTPNPTPVAVVGLNGAASISGGGYHTCARSSGGTLQCWGRNSEGQLGDPATTAFFSATPVPVGGITGATAVTGGGFHTCALLPNGTVRCWGLNDFGQLGNGTVTPANVPNSTPVTVTGVTTAVAVSAGGWHTCALLSNGRVRCWGDNERGQVGDGTPVPTNPFVRRPTPNPVEVVGITTAVALRSGIFHTCALLQDGRVQCWGWNTFGQLGNDPPASNASSTPVTVSGVTSPAALAPGAEHTCLLLPDQTVRCWGDNIFGQVGNGSPRGQGPTNPGASAPVTGITAAIGLTSGAEHSCALLRGGAVQCWGRGLFGRLGDGSTTGADAFTPVSVVGLGARWSSSDAAVATIDAAGVATGRNPGTTTITATAGDRSGSTTLTVVRGSPPPGVTLSIALQGSGTVTSDDGRINCGGGGECSASYVSGTGVSLRATPTGGATFSGWSGCDAVAGATCTVTMSSARSVVATFTGAGFMLSVSRQGPGTGTVTSADGSINCGSGGACAASYPSGSGVNLSATPTNGSTFGGWSGCDVVSGASCTVTMSAARAVSATFSRPRFTLTVTREGLGNGAVTSDDGRINCGGGGACSASYDGGTVVTLRARPAALSGFAGWSGGGCSGTGACTLTLNTNTTVVARFRFLGLF